MKTFYITTSIPYVNSAPHLGNVLDSVYADVLARYKRERGFDVRFLTGSDEHGVKIVRSAAARFAGEPRPSKDGREAVPQEIIQQFVDENSAKFRALKDALNLSWDDFIRTSDQKRHWPGAQKIWQKLVEAGDLYKKTYSGLYCVGHEAFVTEKDLEDGICKDHQKKPETIEEENWFFKLSKYSKEIEKRIRNKELRIIPETREHEILTFLKAGLEDVSFSRPSKDLSWGVPVPGDQSQTMYVWAEALVCYISALGFGSTGSPQVGGEKLFEKFWLKGDEIVQVIGKDNLRFHAAIWPGMLLAAGLPLPKQLFVHGFLTVDGKKISKTVGNVIDPFELVKKYGTDAVRYYLLKEISPFEDGDFSYEKFETLYNADLANGIGNFISRIYQLAHMFIAEENEKIVDDHVKKHAQQIEEVVEGRLGEYKFHEATSSIRDFIAFGDRYVNENKPWSLDLHNASIKTWNLVFISEKLANLIKPFLPETAGKIANAIEKMKNPRANLADPSSEFGDPKKLEPLFPRIQ